MRLTGAWLVLLAMSVVGPAQSQDQQAETAIESRPVTLATSDFQGLTVSEVRFPDVPDRDRQRLRQIVDQQAGQPLERERIRQSIQALFATGRFSDIRAEAERTNDGQVALVFATVPNYFVGDVGVEGTPRRPNANQVVNASKLQLGEQVTQEKLDRAIDNIKDLLQENGYYQAGVSLRELKHRETQQMDLIFVIASGPQARIGHVIVTGEPGYSNGQVQDIAKIHPGDLVSVVRISEGLDRLRKKYQKQNRLLTQVAVASRIYHRENNTVDLTLNIDPGPKVDIVVEGFKVSRGVLKKNVPVYQENALDDDLLNEGRRNLLAYLQGRGYFDASVGVKKHADPQADEMRVFYVIDQGARHKLVKLEITGNEYFNTELLRSHMQVQPAGRLFSRGRYSQKLLSDDLRTLENLYRVNGFQQVKVTSDVTDNYHGRNQLAVELKVYEGPQTRVQSLQVVGNRSIPQSEFPALNIAPGQPFSEVNIASDRDILLNFYFNHGFPNAVVEAAAKPSSSGPNLMDVTYTIREGEQFFVDQILVSGLNFTRPAIVDRDLQLKPGDPVSQVDMLDTQQKLYDLGIFSQVDTAVQNPAGDEPQKNVLVNVEEAKRYTFNYGLGLEFQTGTPSVGANQPLGETGVSPRVEFGVTRLNFRGRDHTITFKSHVGRLQQRGLFSYDAPRWFNSEDWRLSFTTFYDNTLDVTTFTSQRLEGSVQAVQTISKASTMYYRFTFRRVKATNVQVSPDQIPLLSLPVRVGLPEFSYIRDKRNNPLETTNGNYTTIDGGVAASFFGSEADFSRLLIQNATYHPFGKNRPITRKYVFARSTTIGVENPFGNTIVLAPGEAAPANASLIPLPERFFSGGGNSHRGFGLNQAGPRDPITGFPLGGSGLFLNNLELRFPPVNLPFFQDNISFAIFHDAGNVFTNGKDILNSLLHWEQRKTGLCENPATGKECTYNYISQAIGVGVRYKTPIGPVRFDFGYNLNPPIFPSCQAVASGSNPVKASYCPTTAPFFLPQQAKHFNVYFSIGQTF